MDHPNFIASSQKEESICTLRFNENGLPADDWQYEMSEIHTKMKQKTSISHHMCQFDFSPKNHLHKCSGQNFFNIFLDFPYILSGL